MSNKIVISVVAAIAVLSGSAYLVSVHEQTCLSYERQRTSQVKQANTLLEEGVTIKFEQVAQSNPFLALPRLIIITRQMQLIAGKTNDTLYAYQGTCGAERVNLFNASPEFSNLMKTFKHNSKKLSILNSI